VSGQSWLEGRELQLRVNKWSNELVVRQSPAGKDMSTKAEVAVSYSSLQSGETGHPPTVFVITGGSREALSR
jgi:hypothetical protein